MDRFRLFYLSVALCDILGRSTCRPRVFCAFSAPLRQHFNKRCRISKSLYTPFLVMLFLLFLYDLFQGPSIDAGPIPTIEHRSLTGNHCNDLAHCRTIWNIVWSCLATIFSCTWVAMHPTFLAPRSGKRTVGLKDIFRIHFCHLWNIAFPCSSVCYLYLSTCWLGPFDSSSLLGNS